MFVHPNVLLFIYFNIDTQFFKDGLETELLCYTE